MNPGDIVLIRFPQADLQADKLRSALILAVAPGRHADLLLALITSRTYQAVPDFDEIVEASDPDFELTGLKVPSCIRLTRLITVAPSAINARLGNVSSERMKQMRARLARWLDTAPEST